MESATGPLTATAVTLYCSEGTAVCALNWNTIAYGADNPQALAALWAACKWLGFGSAQTPLCRGHKVTNMCAASEIKGDRVLLIDTDLSASAMARIADRCQKVLVISGDPEERERKRSERPNMSRVNSGDKMLSQMTWDYFCPAELRSRPVPFLKMIAEMAVIGTYTDHSSLDEISKDMVALGHWKDLYRGTRLQPIFEFSPAPLLLRRRKRGRPGPRPAPYMARMCHSRPGRQPLGDATPSPTTGLVGLMSLATGPVSQAWDSAAVVCDVRDTFFGRCEEFASPGPLVDSFKITSRLLVSA